jgi:putative sugar O-methyltransferase
MTAPERVHRPQFEIGKGLDEGENMRQLSELIKLGTIRITTKTTYVASRGLRSDSDNGIYPETARRAAREPREFTKFKRNPVYRQILEHVDEEQGARYLQQIQEKWPRLVDEIEKFKINDVIGHPIRFRYPRTGEISPTTLRYLKVASDLRELFGDLAGFHVAEIGCGYGGQFLLADCLWALGSWTLFDLDPVLELVSRYLECHLLKSVYKPITLNRFDSQTARFDLAISNYAFSELPKALQLGYLAKVLCKAKRGYMTMNYSVKRATDDRYLTIAELREHLPALRVLDEVPSISERGFIVAWGQR